MPPTFHKLLGKLPLCSLESCQFLFMRVPPEYMCPHFLNASCIPITHNSYEFDCNELASSSLIIPKRFCLQWHKFFKLFGFICAVPYKVARNKNKCTRWGTREQINFIELKRLLRNNLKALVIEIFCYSWMFSIFKKKQILSIIYIRKSL